jgi:hypothetical protein
MPSTGEEMLQYVLESQIGQLDALANAVFTLTSFAA